MSGLEGAPKGKREAHEGEPAHESAGGATPHEAHTSQEGAPGAATEEEKQEELHRTTSKHTAPAGGSHNATPSGHSGGHGSHDDHGHGHGGGGFLGWIGGWLAVFWEAGKHIVKKAIEVAGSEKGHHKAANDNHSTGGGGGHH